jgi:glycosyltransferase involved in cell wall biosynthesis/O-antigen ligase
MTSSHLGEKSGERFVARRSVLLLAGMPLLLAAAIATAMLDVQGVGRTDLTLPLAGIACVALIAIALYRFEWFVLAVLALRAAVDVTKIGPSTNVLAQVVPGSQAEPQPGPAASAIALLFIGLSVLWLATGRQARSRLTATDGAFAFFVAACAISVAGAVHRSAALSETARILAAVMMFVVLTKLITTMDAVRRVLVACFVALVAPLAVGIGQALSGHGTFVTDGVSRVVGTFLHPNTFGFFLSMFALMAIGIFRYVSVVGQAALGILLCACMVLLVLSYSRGSWIAFSAGLILVAVLQSRRLLLWFAAGAGIALIALPTVGARVLNLRTGADVTGSTGNSFVWRLDYWRTVVHLNDANPVTGIGLNGTRALTDQSKPPHNDALRAFVETGALGLLAYVTVLVALCLIARRALRRTEVGLPRGVAVGFTGVLAAYLIDSMGDNLMSEVVVLWYLYAFAACAVAIVRMSSAGVVLSRSLPKPRTEIHEPARSSAPAPRHLRIAMVGQRGLPATYGGVEHHVQELGARLAALGHEVIVYCRPNYSPTPVDRFRGMRLRHLNTMDSKHFEAIVHSASATVAAIHDKVDVVHYHALGPGLVAPMSRWGSRARVVQTVHGLDQDRSKWGRVASRVLGVACWMSARVPNATIVVSRALQDYYWDEHHRATTYIPNGVTVPRVRTGDSTVLEQHGLTPGGYVLFVGRLVPEKAPDLLLRAFRKLERDDVKLVITGGSSFTAEYVELLEHMAGEDDRVVMPGYVHGVDLDELYSKAALFVLPSDVEGMPLTLLEALSHGTPVLASDIPPHLEVLRADGPGRRIFRQQDEEDLLAKMREALLHPRTERTGAEPAIGSVQEHYNWDDAALALEQLYLAVVRGDSIEQDRPGPPAEPGSDRDERGPELIDLTSQHHAHAGAVSGR